MESVVYWYGKEFDSEKQDIVLSAAIPKPIRSSGNYEVPEKETTKLGHGMAEHGLVCLAQIHTHPGGCSEHSAYDDAHSISRRNGFLSLVAMNYGNVPYFDLSQITIHEAWNGEWLILGEQAKAKRIQIVDDFDSRTIDLE